MSRFVRMSDNFIVNIDEVSCLYFTEGREVLKVLFRDGTTIQADCCQSVQTDEIISLFTGASNES